MQYVFENVSCNVLFLMSEHRLVSETFKTETFQLKHDKNVFHVNPA